MSLFPVSRTRKKRSWDIFKKAFIFPSSPAISISSARLHSPKHRNYFSIAFTWGLHTEEKMTAGTFQFRLIVISLLAFTSIVFVRGQIQLREALQRKALAGPPEEFEQHILPDPTAGAVSADSALYEVFMASEAADRQPDMPQSSWSRQLLVDSLTGFSITFFSPIADKLQLHLQDPSGAIVDLSKFAHEVLICPPTQSYFINIYLKQISNCAPLSHAFRRVRCPCGMIQPYKYLAWYM